MRVSILLLAMLTINNGFGATRELDFAKQMMIAYVTNASSSIDFINKFPEVNETVSKFRAAINEDLNILTVDCPAGKIAFVNNDDSISYNKEGKLQIHICRETLKTSAEEIAQTLIHELIHLIDHDPEEESTTKKELLIVYFGGGAPSLSYMQDFPINEVSIEEVLDTEEYRWLKIIGIDTTDDFLIALARSYAITGYSKRIQKILSSFGSRKNIVLNFQDNLGQTPIMLAIREGNIDCVKVLLENGAKLDLKSNSGETALGIAKKYQRSESLKLLERYTTF
ncbi:MAG: hypothetical protein A2451_00135 [Bdellovibrionales bacterium RIFOXYC2_FULL_39_8]|nr:MAG: hypothetical protein A2451_00135 [Bdellovibrionales bacterium RIFOXYC2_FULL_39_8]HLE13037.1 ankyrin repeat domain-containing protein [Bacteriovoracaceae bacterium]